MAPVGIDDDQLQVMRSEANAPVFATAAAREEYERARRLQRVVRMGLGLLLLAAWSVVIYRLGGGSSGGEDEHGHEGNNHENGKPLEVAPVGAPGAAVKITCIVPAGTECHAPIITFLSDTAKRQPDKMRVEFKDMNEVDEKKLTDEVGSYCAAVIINGKTFFDIKTDKGVQHVSLVGTTPTHYSIRDVAAALEQTYAQVYGDTVKPAYVLPQGADDGPNHDRSPPPAARSETLDLQVPAFKPIEPPQK